MITVRPSRAGFRSIIASGMGLSIAGLVSGLFRGHGGIELLAPPIATIIAATLIALAFRANARVELAGDTITVRSLIGTRRTIPVDDVAIAVDARRVDAGAGVSGRLALLNSEGFALLRLNGSYWTSGGLRDLSRAFGERRDVLREPIRAREFIELHPHALSFRTRHPFLSSGLTLAAIVGVALGYVWFVDTAL